MTLEKQVEIRNLIASGLKVYQACDRAGISLGQWYYHRRLEKRTYNDKYAANKASK